MHHYARREAAEQHELAAQTHRTAAEHNEKGNEVHARGGIHNERWNTRITPTNSQKKPTTNRGGWRRSKTCPLATTTDPATRTISERLNCTMAPRTRIELPSNMENRIT